MTLSPSSSLPPAGPGRGGIPIASLLRRLVLFCVLPPLALASLLAWQQLSDHQLQREQAASRLAVNFAASLDQLLDARIRALGMLAGSPMAEQPAHRRELYREALEFQQNFGSHVLLVDGRDPARMLFNTRLPFGSPLPPVPKVRGEGAVPRALATGKAAVGDSFMGPVAGKRLVAVAVPVLRAGRTASVLLTTLDADFFQRRLDLVSLPPAWSLTIADGRGDAIARRSPPGRQEVGRRVVARLSRSAWSVQLEIPEEAYRKPMLTGAFTLGGGVLAATLIAIFSGVGVSRYLARAVAGLTGEHGSGEGEIREITAARRVIEDAAAGVRQSEERFRRLFAEAPLPLCFVGSDGRVLDRNSRFRQLLGYGESELKSIDDWWRLAYPDPEYRAQMRANWEAALAAPSVAGEHEARECRVTCKDGLERTMLLSSIVLPEGVLVSFFDLTDRMRAEQALRDVQASALEKQKRARLAALNQMEDAVAARRSAEGALAALRESEILLNAMGRTAHIGGWDLDLSTGRVHWTEEMARIYELDGAVEAPADLGLGFYGEQARLCIERALHQATRQGIPFDLELEMVSAKGTHKWIRTICEPSLEKGKVVKLHGALQDVSDLKLAEREIRLLNADLERRVEERTAKLRTANEELDSFAYAVSHDLRAPLRAMMGFSQALIEDYGGELQGEATVYLEQIVSGSRQMGQLIDGLLALSRSGRRTLSIAPVDLSALARRIRLVLERAEPQRRVAWEIEPGLCAEGDGRMLEAVLQNLLGNAWKYTANCADPRIRFRAELREGRRFFCVSDNGAGFSMDHAGRLFKPFQRLHRQDEFPGIGIGLATVQRIIQRHGGEIEADGRPGDGATFRFTLPISESC